MPSHLLKHVHTASGDASWELTLVDIGTLFWLVIYVLAIVGGFRNRTYAIPLGAICANFAWELIAAFYRIAPEPLWHAGDILWLCFDLLIVWTLLRYGRKRQQIPEIQRAFYAVVGATFVFALVLQLTLEAALRDEWGFLDAYLITVMMSVLFFFFYFSRRMLDNGSYAIAWCKLFGNGLISIGLVALHPGLEDALADTRLLHFLCSVTFLLDLSYVGLLARARRTKSSSLDMSSSSRAASAA